METTEASRLLSALAGQARLEAMRYLVRQGPEGAPAGEIAAYCGAAASTMSFHLKELKAAGLIDVRRDSRQLIYRADMAAMRRLIDFLTEDCCQGQPERCPTVPPTRRGPRAMTPNDPDKIFNVLFLCTGNSARSIMAECILNREGQGRFRGYSAGSKPAGELNPRAIAVLKRNNYPLDGLRSKNWDEFAAPDAPKMDFVFTVCDDAASEVCPVWPGQPMSAHWGVPDPAKFTGTEAEVAQMANDVFRMLYTRITLFLSLPLASIDKLSLQKRLDTIGQSARTTEPTEAPA
ncbi:helix-turn-helix domain-containing protein [Roseospirillum parvum]|uniref:Arsenate reductase n=1 Tax=Roseospirillum parvum TaxID=83401 RepID=A0A1G8BP87_9PROT|nr:helix-turn-helix domain-containing protein [Roseospirillum parvum]SDH35016.1 arsenate reductase [Roseospirillum parvum]